MSAITKHRPTSEFPELIVTVPDSWSTIKLAPLYDVHIGNINHDAALFTKHVEWIRKTPNVLTWNGGDMIENVTENAPGRTEQTMTPQAQIDLAKKLLKPIGHKLLFSLPGNHEDRSEKAAGLQITRWMTDDFDAPFFPDYCFCTIKWRGNNFRILAHHGSGSATTAGAQRMAARKALSWAKVFDLCWTGHLHNPLADMLYQTDFDQRTGTMYERGGVVMISPSYLKYFGSYAAKKQYSPGTRGLAVVELQADGRMDVSVHAVGRRL